MYSQKTITDSIASLDDQQLVDRWREGKFSDEARPIAEAELRRRGMQPEDAVAPEGVSSAASQSTMPYGSTFFAHIARVLGLPALTRFSPKRLVLVMAASPLLGGFMWGAVNPPNDWNSFFGRLIHGFLAAVGTYALVLFKPSRLFFWPYIVLALLLLLWLALRWPRASIEDG